MTKKWSFFGKNKASASQCPEDEMKFGQLAENIKSQYFFYRHDANGVFKYVSPSIKEMLGYSPEEFFKHYSKYLTPSPINKDVAMHTTQSLNGIKQPPYEVEIYHKDGSIRWLEVSEVPVFDAGEKVIAVEGLARDITEKRITSERLEKVIDFLNATGEMAKVGGWEFDVGALKQTWTREVYLIHELPLDFEPDVHSGIDFYVPEDREMVKNVVQRAIDHGEAFDFESQIVTAKGNRRWVHSIGRAYLEGGKTVRVGGTFKDITEQKIAQDKIKEAAEEWQRTFDSISDIVFILDADNTVRRVNRVFLDAFKLGEKEAVGRKCYEMVHKSEKPWPLCPHVETMTDGKPHTREVNDPVLGIPLLVTTSPIVDDKGKCIGSVHIAKDITEIQNAKKAIEEKITELERFQKVTMGREMRVIELKEEIAKLKAELEKSRQNG